MASMSAALSSLLILASLAMIGCLALLQGQQQQQQQYTAYPAWLYSMPWRPVVPVSTTQLSQLSPGFTGPQTFPFVQRQQRKEQQRLEQQGLYNTGSPVQGMFSLPFRPSPFAGYTEDYEEYQGGGEGVGAGSVEEPARETDKAGAYVYLSPGRLYSLFRS